MNNKRAKIITGIVNQLNIIEADINDLVMKSSPPNSMRAVCEPKNGDVMNWSVNGETVEPPIKNERESLPTHEEDANILRESWLEAERNGNVRAESFNSGIPVVFIVTDDGQKDPDVEATLAYWQELPPCYTYNPYILRVAQSFVDSILDMKQSGLWHDTTHQIGRETVEMPIHHMQFVLPWKIRESRHKVWPNGDASYQLRVQPINPLCGIADGLPVDEFDPFGSNHPIAAIFNYEIVISEDRIEAIFPADDADDYSEYCFLQLIVGEEPGTVHGGRPGGGAWERMAGEDVWPSFMWTLVHDATGNCIGRLAHYEPKSNQEQDALNLPQADFWKVVIDDFGDDGFEATYRERVLKETRYGRPHYLWTHQTEAHTIRCGKKSMTFDTLASYLLEGNDAAMAEDDEWGESSRFVPAFKDKRKLKIIDQTQGTRAYWSDVLRCRICNGQCKVLLKEVPIKVIFDCPHCGESGCIDCTHCQPGSGWPESKTRKVVKSK